MTSREPRTQEKIFADMHRELRVWNPEIPESPDRLDPILKILLQLYAHQLSIIDGRIDRVWESASQALIRSVCPESRRWPIPAYTVMRCIPSDPVVEVDPHTRFFYKEKREGGQTFFFSATRRERLLSAEVKYIYFLSGNMAVNLSPRPGGATGSRQQIALNTGAPVHIIIGINYAGQPGNFERAALFLKGMPEVLKQMRWSHWIPGDRGGKFQSKFGFCPGRQDSISEMFRTERRSLDWGGLRTAHDIFKALEDNFILLPESFTAAWEAGPPNEEVVQICTAGNQQPPPADEKCFWIRLDLPTGGEKQKLYSSFEFYFNCFIAVNKNELTLFKHTGGNRLVEVEIPEDLSHVLEIINVVDSSGREYQPHFLIQSNRAQKSYALEERGGKLILWFDFSADIELPPDSITVTYSVTAGTDANGIEAGRINELYENHPGIAGAENLIPAGGAIPAKTEEQIVSEVSARLRNRDRALSFSEIAHWALTFDPRIKGAECINGIERAERGVRRCLIITIKIRPADFYSEDEIELLRIRLGSFLKSRAPVNTHFKVEINKG